MVFDEKEIENEIKLRKIMLKYNEDDPLLQTYMLYNLFNTYKKHNIQIPEEMLKYIETQIIKINTEFPHKLEKLKAEIEHKKNPTLNKTIEKIDKKIEEKSKKDSLFPEGYFSR